MEVLESVVRSSDRLDPEQIQKLMILAKKHPENDNLELWNQTIDVLWKNLEDGFVKTDDQLLCATCFFNIILKTNKLEDYLRKVKLVVENEIAQKSKHEHEGSNTLQAISLMYGMFQSSFLIQNHNFDTNMIVEVLSSVFKLLLLIAYEYSQYTLIAIKTISSLKKVCGMGLQSTIFNYQNQIVLLNMVNHNWENPITGVRDLIRTIFQTLLTTMDEKLYVEILNNINSFYWNKARYLMLSEIVEYSNEDVSNLIVKNNWLDGLINSLYKPGLVSAGADMYNAILKKIHQEEEWNELFLDKIVKILNSNAYKAIENFNNYWCLNTLKKYPSLLNKILDLLDKCPDSDEKMLSTMYVMKQGNKLGLLNKNWANECLTDTEKLILTSLEHNNTQIRMLAFDILCLSHLKTMPSKTEYDPILDYIRSNINSDCTVLRLNLLTSFNLFISQIHILFRNIKDHVTTSIKDMVDFFQQLQEFVIWSLNVKGNYQRKITSVKILNTVVTCCCEIQRKKKQQTRDTGPTLIEYLKKEQIWTLHDQVNIEKLLSLLKDPSDDIRESVFKLLLNHYSCEFNMNTSFYCFLVEEALKCRKSKFFYDICCSQVMFKLIVNLLMKKERTNMFFNNVSDVFNYAYQELTTEYKTNKDILTSIVNGKQLHSFICILQVLLEACLTNSYSIDIPNETLTNLLNILEGVTDQFTWENNSTSSDFSKINDMVESIIVGSGCVTEENDETKISSLHQIVLNGLWLNVKAACDLAALLIQYNSKDLDKCTKCLNIITHVLETSRHKGAIEAAGSSLGKSIQYLTTLPEDSEVSKLPQTLLISKLNVLISEASKMASITRRGAGLSIMVHKIVSSDMRKGKPLFHYFMKTLLKTCANTENVPSSQDATNVENQMDLPKAILIHFLTKIVTDSSLASDMMFYSSELAELAFGNLTSPHWQIRNAALQLYGALIPRLIGQKKASGSDDETIATVGYDELRTHSPKLWRFLIEQLDSTSDNKLILHSNLVPILNLLASVAMRYNFTFDLEKQLPFDESLLRSLFKILDSPIHAVRRLTAKCIFNIFPFKSIYGMILKGEYGSENFLHGSLLVLKYCHNYYAKQGVYNKELEHLKEIFSKLLSLKNHSYWTRDVLENISTRSYELVDIQSILSEVAFNNPGSFLWANTCIKNYILNTNWSNLVDNLKVLLKQTDYELYCQFLLEKLEKDDDISADILSQITHILLSFNNKYNSTIIWKILYFISGRTKLTHIDVSVILDKSNVDESNYKLRYLIPFVATLFTNLDNTKQQSLQLIIYRMSDFEFSDVDVRYIAAISNNEIGNVFDELLEEAKINSLKTAILLLQDEDEDIRNIAVDFYKNIKKLKVALQPYICLNRILDNTFLSKAFMDPRSINIMCESLINLLTNNVHNITENYNPFANDSKNFYIEIPVIRQMLTNIIRE